MRRWTAQEHERLIALWAEGLSGPAIAARLGRTKPQVTAMVAWLRAKGDHAIAFRGKAHHRTRAAAIPPGTGEVRIAGIITPARIMDADGRVTAMLDPLTRVRTPV